MRSLVLTTLVVIVISSCASKPSKNVITNLLPNSTEGIIVGTISVEMKSPIYNSYFFHYNKVLEDSFDVYENRIWIYPNQMIKKKHDADYVDGSKAVYLFSVKEFAGNYQFSLVKFNDNAAPIYLKSFEKTLDFPFEIKKGKVTYFGEIYLDTNNGIIEKNDMSDRDLKYFGEKFPNLNIVE